ncbi:bacteriohemerythrin [Magnetospirillum sulfuroxidans]|uniref:Hemerythrin family protein n=1 Tax=Magnetospirillum sulfuroxidans TaxID=611300 RepID=A0ABS5IBY2_9PROT|nr:hemerythrin family protein [Magnetospirillum sulfuroxidans]MBR9971667.1 hemerythrin family protein [Magnetospirillum sulfuroxidans]
MDQVTIMLVTWDDDYGLGYKVVDEGHALVIDAINRLNVATSRAHRDGEVAGLLPVLHHRLSQQFAEEEALLRLLNSANLAEHMDEHARFLSVLAHIRQLFNDGQDVASVLLLNLVCHLVSHLRGTDWDEFGDIRHRQAA